MGLRERELREYSARFLSFYFSFFFLFNSYLFICCDDDISDLIILSLVGFFGCRDGGTVLVL